MTVDLATAERLAADALRDQAWAADARLALLHDAPDRFRFFVTGAHGETLFGAPWIDVAKADGIVTIVPPLSTS